MLTLPRTIRVFVATRPVHAAAGADVLTRRVRNEIGADPLSGDIYCFFSRRHTRVKLLVWDQNGFWVMSKRLERGRFESFDARRPWLELARDELVMLLAGIDMKTKKFRRQFAREIRIESRARGEPSRASR